MWPKTRKFKGDNCRPKRMLSLTSSSLAYIKLIAVNHRAGHTYCSGTSRGQYRGSCRSGWHSFSFVQTGNKVIVFLFVLAFVRSIVFQLHSKRNSDTHLCWSAMTMGMRVYTAVSLSTTKKNTQISNIFFVKQFANSFGEWKILLNVNVYQGGI